jgi:nicotinamidase-related amidase
MHLEELGTRYIIPAKAIVQTCQLYRVERYFDQKVEEQRLALLDLLGRFLVRGEAGHDIIPELYPLEGEPIIDKPMRSAFNFTDFDLLLRNKGFRNLVVCINLFLSNLPGLFIDRAISFRMLRTSRSLV